MVAKIETLIGGVDHLQQAIALAKHPHIIVATPGRLVDHLEKTNGFSLKNVKVLVDAGKSEADVIAAKPLADLEAKWGNGFLNSDTFAKIVYQSVTCFYCS